METECIGRAVISGAGRDKGRKYLITGVVDDDHVWLADGDKRKLAEPKKKKLKHLNVLPETAEEIAVRIKAGGRVEDHEIRAWLEAHDENNR